ncbi:MAG: hypothetical protein PHD76_10645 [Methylacidiphilales bacterium]|nr:hypothetical protein [Candidatus Methylacidiphilales bacterium]
MKTNAIRKQSLLSLLIPVILGISLACTTASATELTNVDTDDWVSVSTPANITNCDMIAVDPTTGNLYLYGKAGELEISQDKGATWTSIPCPVTGGSGGFGSAVNMAYPFTGRIALFAGDGHSGITLDGGKTWRQFDVTPHSCQWGDVDWSSPEPSLMIDNSWDRGDGKQPAVSTDLGKSWTMSSPLAGVWGPKNGGGDTKVGIFDSNNILAANGNSKGILISHDCGTTWTKTADFTATGNNPIHYGTRLYWVSTQGVMTTTNGSDWNLLGTALPNAISGPYFGKSEGEMMVITGRGVFITLDAAGTWRKVSELPKVIANGKTVTGNRVAWDPIHNLIYAIMGQSVWRLQVK